MMLNKYTVKLLIINIICCSVFLILGITIINTNINNNKLKQSIYIKQSYDYGYKLGCFHGQQAAYYDIFKRGEVTWQASVK